LQSEFQFQIIPEPVL